MTTSQFGGSSPTERSKTRWVRRSLMATAFAAAGALTLGVATAPAQAQYYGGNPYYAAPYYAYPYRPYYYGYGYPAYGVGLGWGGGWHGGWRGGGYGGHGGHGGGHGSGHR
jgi:hypothetical protein